LHVNPRRTCGIGVETGENSLVKSKNDTGEKPLPSPTAFTPRRDDPRRPSLWGDCPRVGHRIYECQAR